MTSLTERSLKWKTLLMSSSSVLSKTPLRLPSSRRILISASPMCSSPLLRFRVLTRNKVVTERKLTNMEKTRDTRLKKGRTASAALSL
ncbi:MAG: hypothetical protein A4E61_00617 [Syntrophorhabdus sp. PtaB.Bin184]|nr:MAG: hypothetical protein A4E61_00617 [Syntrophorhabdus sp. PtaB.Bin184]